MFIELLEKRDQTFNTSTMQWRTVRPYAIRCLGSCETVQVDGRLTMDNMAIVAETFLDKAKQLNKNLCGYVISNNLRDNYISYLSMPTDLKLITF